MKRYILFLGFLVFVILINTSLGVIPKLINYQGMLTGSDGKTPVNNGNYAILFSIYNTSSGGSSLWSHTYNVTVTNGLFNVILGDSGAPISLPFNVDYWLELKVGADPPLSPRIKLTSVAYAYRASVADSAVASPPPSTGGGWTDDGSVVRLTTVDDKVRIGTTSLTPVEAKLCVKVGATGGFDRLRIECPASNNGFGIDFNHPGGYWYVGPNGGNWNDNRFTIANNVNPLPRMVILSDGKVGIGMTDPKVKLDVADMIRVKGATWPAPVSGSRGMELAYDSASHHGYIQVYNRGNSSWGTLYLGDGTVGIGTEYTAAKFHVVQNASGTAVSGVSNGASGYGVAGYGKTAGGYFKDSDQTGYAYIGYQTLGLEARGDLAGGYFYNHSGNAWAYLAHESDPGIYHGITATGSNEGGEFWGNDAGVHCVDMNSGVAVWVACGDKKITGGGSVSFIQNHPYNKDQVIVYTAPEGDEVATYTRGHARLVNGEAQVMLGETFKWVTNPDIGLTAHITPRAECEGLYVASLTTNEMVVKELRGGTSNAEFDYLVYGLRIGFEEASVVQEKTEEAYIPSMKDHRDLYNKYPELRHFNALERFREMNAQIGKSFDLGASHALRDAIHEFDPAIDKLPEPGKH